MPRAPPLRAVHESRGASFTPFGGWEMPVEFDSIRTEHDAVRESVGRFDVSHMSQLRVTGPDAAALTQRLTTNDVAALAAGRGQYAAVTDERGVMLDDVVVYRLPQDDPTYLVVPNAGHDGELVDWWTAHRDRWGLDATVENATEEYAMFAIQGPHSEAVVADAAGEPVRELSFFQVCEATVADVECLVSRSGYTGEDGFELLCSWDDAETVWGAFDCQPCGLGARDTLRIEQGYLLSGQDFDPEEEPRTPYEAGIGFAVRPETGFVGSEALAADPEPDERFVGIELTDRGVPRHGYEVLAGGERVGHLTSGTMSPSLGRGIGLGYVARAHATPATELTVEIRGREKAARVVETPFEDRENT